MAHNTRPLTSEELLKNVQAKLQKAGLDVTRYTRQLKDIASLFEPERSRAEQITEGPRAGAWEMFCYFKGIRHCFHSARDIAKTFGIPIARTAETAAVAAPAPASKRKRDEEQPAPVFEQHVVDAGAADDLYASLTKPEPPKKKAAALKKSGRMGSRFQNQKLVKAINAHVGMEVVCGNLRARLVSANLGGMTFELLDESGRPCGDMVPPSQLAKRSCLAHQNNAWKSIKVDGITLDSWVCRLQEEIEGEDGGTDGALHAAMFMQRVDEMRGPGGSKKGGGGARSADDDTATADEEDEYNSGDSDQQRSNSGGASPSKGLKLLSGAAMQRIRHNGQQAESDVPLPQHDMTRYDSASARGMMDGLYSAHLPAALPGMGVDQSVKLVVNVVDPEGGVVNTQMATRLAQLEQLHARTLGALRSTTDTLRQLLGEAEKLGITLVQ